MAQRFSALRVRLLKTPWLFQPPMTLGTIRPKMRRNIQRIRGHRTFQNTKRAKSANRLMQGAKRLILAGALGDRDPIISRQALGRRKNNEENVTRV